jgi:pimeloyl-ACP methyl ester carboxylesterase
VLARRLLLLLAAELAAYCLIALWLVRTHAWNAGAAGALMVAVAIGWRVAFTLTTYAVAWIYRSATPEGFRISTPALVAHVLREVGAMAAVYALLQPFERVVMGPPLVRGGDSARLPVLFLHGYACNRAAGWALVRGLRRRGETVWAPTLEPVYGAIEEWVEPLASAIDSLRAATGAARVVVVTHSMGGLAARAYLRAHGSGKLAQLMTLGSPHFGSEHARLGLGKNAREMEPGSAWLAELARDERGLGIPFISVYSHHDNLVAPQSSGAHPAARNVPLAGVGHVTLLFSPEVRALVEQVLDALNAAS